MIPSPAEEPAEQRRLDGRRQLGHVVDAGQAPDLTLGQAYLSKPQALELFGGSIELPIFVVDHQDEELAVRVVGQERRREHPRVREVVSGDDRAAGDHSASAGQDAKTQ